MSFVIALASGLIFGIGLIVSGMTNPSKVQDFLDLAGQWDPSLALVMGGAIAIGLPAFARAGRQAVSWTGARIDMPTHTKVDARLLVGGLLFGVGWGMAGYCPGPAIVSAAAGSPVAAIFVVAMLAGMALHDRFLAPGRR